MTSAPNAHTRLVQRVAWAKRELDVERSDDSAKLQSTLLRHLAEEEFVPNENWEQAFLALQDYNQGVTSTEDPQAFLLEEEVLLEHEVEQFALVMLDLPCDQRRSRWQDLAQRCQYSSRPLARLKRLEQGLDIDFSSLRFANTHLARMCDYLKELFPLRPVVAANRRLEIIEEMNVESDFKMKKWENAAWRIQRKYPVINSLDPALTNKLSLLRNNQLNVKRQQAVQERHSRKPSLLNRKIHWYWIVVGLIVLARFSTMVNGCGKSNTSAPATLPPITQESIDGLLQRVEPDGTESESSEKLRDILENMLKEQREKDLSPTPPMQPDEKPRGDLGND